MDQPTYPKWTPEEIAYLKENYLSECKEVLMDNLNHSWSSIVVKAGLLKVNGRRNRFSLMYNINNDFFKSWNCNMAYVLGFFCADGCMTSPNGRGESRVSFSSKDVDILESIRNAMGSDHKIHKYGNGFQLVVGNGIIYADLIELGLTPKKSLTLQFPEVPDKYLMSFVRGVFDGDGSFGIRKLKTRGHLRARITGNHDFLLEMKRRIEVATGLEETSFYVAHKDDPRYSQKVFVLDYYNEKAVALGNAMYEEPCEMKLQRKYDIYKEFK